MTAQYALVALVAVNVLVVAGMTAASIWQRWAADRRTEVDDWCMHNGCDRPATHHEFVAASDRTEAEIGGSGGTGMVLDTCRRHRQKA